MKNDNNINLIRRWFTAIALAVIGNAFYQLLQSNDFSKILDWFQISDIAKLQCIKSYPFILAISYLLFKPRSSFISLNHLRLSKILKFPPYWLFFWGGYLLPSLFIFFKDHLLLHYSFKIIIFPLIFLAIACDWGNLLAKIIQLLKNIFSSNNQFSDNNIQPLEETSLKIAILENTNNQNITLLNRLRKWANLEQPIDNIANDLFEFSPTIEQINSYLVNNIESKSNKIKPINAIGIVGAFGSGKSSLITLVEKELLKKYENKIIFITIDCWEFDCLESLEQFILNKISVAVRIHIDAANLINLPKHWLELIKGISENNWLNLAYKSFKDNKLDSILIELSEAIKCIDIHFVLNIQDIDRRTELTSHMGSLQRLIEYLKQVQGITILIAFDPTNTQIKEGGFDYSRLCDQLIYMPTVPIKIIENIMDVLIFTLGSSAKNWDNEACKDFPLIWKDEDSAEITINYISAREFALIAGTPRKIKGFIRNVINGWENVKDEVNFFDFILISFINEYLPSVKIFLITHIKIISLIIEKSNTTSLFNISTETTNILLNEWKVVCSKLKVEEQIVARKIMATLFYEIYNPFLDDKELKVSNLFYTKMNQQRIFENELLWRIALEGRVNKQKN